MDKANIDYKWLFKVAPKAMRLELQLEREKNPQVRKELAKRATEAWKMK